MDDARIVSTYLRRGADKLATLANDLEHGRATISDAIEETREIAETTKAKAAEAAGGE